MKRKSSPGADAAQTQTPAGRQEFVLARVVPLVQQSAGRVAPLAHSAAGKVAPLTANAAERINAATVLISPYATSAAGHITPIAVTAAEKVVPLAQSAAGRVGPLAAQAIERVTPYTHQAVDLVTPYAHQAAHLATPYVEKVGPLASSARARGVQAAHLATVQVEKVAPLAAAAKVRGVQAAHEAVDALTPKLDVALDRVTPTVDAARSKVTEALAAAAAAPAVAQATKRGKATLAAARGDLTMPEPVAVKNRSWIKRLAVLVTLVGVAAVVVRKLLGNKDADWQAARPTTPYAPSTPANASTAAAGSDDGQAEDLARPSAGPVDGDALVPETAVDAADLPTDAVEAGPQTPVSSEEYVPSSVADEGRPSSEAAGSSAVNDLGSRDEAETSTTEPLDVGQGLSDDTTAESSYAAEGAYVGSEPPAGFVIKGNENSMKYHTPDSGGYDDTVAEVWFSSEQAAEEAGFVRAQG